MKNTKPKIIIESGALKRIAAILKPLGQSFIIISDSNLEKQAQDMMKAIQRSKARCGALLAPAGENAKSLEIAGKIAESMMKLGARRDSVLIAFGGGVIGDLAGFTASIFMRGIRFALIPTTLLAMADSGIGGKTGVDLNKAKNVLGTFYTPEIIVIDLNMLKTLPQKQFVIGLAEIVKHGVIASKPLFNYLEKNSSAILKRKPKCLKRIIKDSIRIKLKIVGHDERESIKITKNRSRMLLNYGHTVGHALEQLSNFAISHGEAVSIGMVAENRIATGKNMLKEAEARRIASLLKKFGLPVQIPSEYSPAQIKKALSSDKKNIGGKLHFALPVKIGKAVIKQYDY